MDVFGTKQKILAFFYHMRHVIIRAISPVANKDIFGARHCDMAVCHVTEGPEFILLMNRLDQSIRISNVFADHIKHSDAY